MQFHIGFMEFDIVTGGCGFIGSHLVDALLSDGRRVLVIDNGPQYRLAHHKQGGDFRIDSHDISQWTILDHRDTFPNDKVRHIFHLAALADIIPSIENPRKYYDTNVTGTLNVLEMARLTSCSKFIYAASASCYGDAPEIPTHEYCNINPKYPYALTKYLGEQLVMHWAAVYKVHAISLRLFNVYGTRSRTNGTYGAMFGTFLAQLANDKPLTVVGDGTQYRDFVHVNDVVQAFLKVAEIEKNGEIYNIGGSHPISVNEIVRQIGALETTHIPKRPGEPEITHAECEKAWEDFGWEPQIDIETGIKDLLSRIDDYKGVFVWTPEDIQKATAEWFERLA